MGDICFVNGYLYRSDPELRSDFEKYFSDSKPHFPSNKCCCFTTQPSHVKTKVMGRNILSNKVR